MDNDPKRLCALLRIARTENGAAAEPELATALRQAGTDPELAAIAKAEAVFDRTMAAKLREGIAVPADLRARLLALDPARATDQPEPLAVPFPPQARPARTWSVSITGLAAAAAVFIVGALVLRSPPAATPPAAPTEQPTAALAADPLSSLVQAVAQRMASPPDFEYRGANLDDLRQFLNNSSAPAPWMVPAGLRDRPTEGCATFLIDGSPITLVVFKGDHSYRLFVAKRDDFPGCAERYRPAVEKVAGHAVAVWTCRKALYFVTSDSTEANFDDLL